MGFIEKNVSVSCFFYILFLTLSNLFKYEIFKRKCLSHFVTILYVLIDLNEKEIQSKLLFENIYF